MSRGTKWPFTYPDGRMIVDTYGFQGTLNDRIDRPVPTILPIWEAGKSLAFFETGSRFQATGCAIGYVCIFIDTPTIRRPAEWLR
jgi:hypothetical protein